MRPTESLLLRVGHWLFRSRTGHWLSAIWLLLFCVTHVTSLSKIPQLPNLIQQGIFLKCATRQDVQDPAQGLADFVLCFDKAHLVEGLDIG